MGFSSISGISSGSSYSSFRPTQPTNSGKFGACGKIGSGRTAQQPSQQLNFYKLLLAKNGFVEVPASMLPEKARAEMARKLGPHEAVTFYMNPTTGAFSALTQNERNPNEVSLYNWNTKSNSWMFANTP